MDENADLRLTIETARKNENWGRRCYAYELAIEYFSLLDPDCYELCSYCDLIPEFLEERNECCLLRALGAVKVFVSRCVEAPSIARAVTRVIIERIFFSASTKVREMATDIILDFIEWEAGNSVLKELISGALKYDGVRSEECVKVMRYALLDFGPHVISVYKLIDFLAALVRNKSYLSTDDECSQLLIVIYKCLGPSVRVHLTPFLDTDYIAAIEDSYEEMRNIPIYHCRFVRYSKDNSTSLGDSDEEMFASCRIAEPKSHPAPNETNCKNEKMASEGKGLILDGDEHNFGDSGRESYNRGVGSDPYGSENKGYWDPPTFDNVDNYQFDDGAEGLHPVSRNHVRSNAYDNVLAYDVFNHSNRVYSVPELHYIPDACQSPERGYQWNPDHFEPLNDHIAKADIAIQTGRCTIQNNNPFEVIMRKLMDKFGAKDTLYWLYLKLNSKSNIPLNDTVTNKSRTFSQQRNCKSLENLVMDEGQIHNEARSSVSDTSRKQYSPIGEIGSSYAYNPNESSFHQESLKNHPQRPIRHRTFPSCEKRLISNQTFFLTKSNPNEKEGNCSGLVKTESELGIFKRSLVGRFFKKICSSLTKKKKTPNNIIKDEKSFSKKLQFVFRLKRNHKNHEDSLSSSLIDKQQKHHFDQQISINPSKMKNGISYVDKQSNSQCRVTSYKITHFPSKRNTFFCGMPTSLNHIEIFEQFKLIPEDLQQREDSPKETIKKFSKINPEHNEREVIYSESESPSEISPNQCSYSSQNYFIRRLASKDLHKCEKQLQVKDAPGEGKIGFERSNEDTSASSTAERTALFEGGGEDEISQPAYDGET